MIGRGGLGGKETRDYGYRDALRGWSEPRDVSPIVLCDFCGRQIAEATTGNVLYVMGLGSVDGQLYYTHKQCNDAFESSHPLAEGG
jgi:hypothetical protein